MCKLNITSMSEGQFDIIMSGAQITGSDKTAIKSRFTVRYPQPIRIPDTATECVVSVQAANIWNSVRNITATNNVFRVYVPNASNQLTWYSLLLSPGLYDIDSFAAHVTLLMQNEGILMSTQPITVAANYASGKVVLKFAVTGVKVDFTAANSCHAILGFAAQEYGGYAANQTPQNLEAPNPAKFNQYDSLQIHASLVDEGLLLNDKYYQTVAQVPMNAGIGQVVYFSPYNPSRVYANRLVGSKLDRISVWLTTQDGVTEPDLGGEDFSVRFRIEWR